MTSEDGAYTPRRRRWERYHRHLFHNGMHAYRTGASSGPYDDLYRASGILWPERPGRMVRRAAEMLPPGRALDVGCGDGKNLLYLERQGWTVDAIDVSPLAIEALELRLAKAGHEARGEIFRADATNVDFGVGEYDLVVAYGLYHCLDDDALEHVHLQASRALKPRGGLAVAILNEELPIPDGHCADTVYLRPRDHVLQLNPRPLTIHELDYGEIEESHPPLIGPHRHAVTWGLFEKRGET